MTRWMQVVGTLALGMSLAGCPLDADEQVARNGDAGGDDAGPGGLDGSVGPDDDAAPAPACVDDADCPAGQACAAGACVESPDERLCDGLDEDGDGRIDEGLDCPGPGGCGDGCPPNSICVEDACRLVCSEDAHCDAGDVCVDGVCGPGQRAEVCNGLDDDGDGQVDEGLNCGQPGCADDAACPPNAACIDGECVVACAADADCADPGDVCINGLCTPRPCAGIDMDGDGADGCSDCDDRDPTVGPQGVETCDGRDEDCDGRIDEGVCGVDDCNGQDDDGDGVVDEDCMQCDAERACPPNAVCRAGRCLLVCGADEHCPPGDRCVDQVCTPDACGAPEVCNGQDDDCDGRVDEGACQPNACMADADCPAGLRCVAGLCAVPGIDDCNGLDDDGDGLVDEDCSDACGGVRCAPGEACVNGECVAACNADLDCAAGEVCFAGQCIPGMCAADLDGDGANACADCDDADPLRSPDLPEICDDGVDNDCNGAVDDCAACPPGLDPIPDQGACLQDDAICFRTADGQWCTGPCIDANGDGQCDPFCRDDADCPPDAGCVQNVCAQLGEAAGERCGNGLDDDLDGLVDEGC
ncbi:MAG: putative metal-binding motif-containing protein [Myxococcales bacterium]|nr:putative metal-binding motif-containing protein [Myxococcales bacterium]